MMEMVACVATGLFSMVASMYSPFSVKAFGTTLVLESFAVENFDRKLASSSWLSSNK